MKIHLHLLNMPTRLVVDRDKLSKSVFCVLSEVRKALKTPKVLGKYSIWTPLYPFIHGPNYCKLHQKTTRIWRLDFESLYNGLVVSFKGSFIMFYLSMVDYPSCSLHCPPWLGTPFWHSGVLGASIWPMYSQSDLLKVIGWVVGWVVVAHEILEAKFLLPYFTFYWVLDFGLGIGLGLVNNKSKEKDFE